MALHLRTARYLRPSQIFYWLLRRYLNLHRITHSDSTDEIRDGVRLGEIIRSSRVSLEENTFSFLNKACRLDLSGMDWDCADMPRIWRYNLHYFDYMLEYGRSEESVTQLTNDWIERNPQQRPGDGAPHSTPPEIPAG